MRKILFTALTVFCILSANAQHDHMDSVVVQKNETFEKIKSLAGEWHGTFKWSVSNVHGEMNAKYYFTGNGTTVVEDLIQEGAVMMTTVYHLDGKDLRATHYCAAGNQPRLRAVKYDSNSVVFNFVDVTNLATPEAAHVKGLELHFNNANSLSIIFTFASKNIERLEEISLIRTR